jgi:hypothetical protein
MADKDTLWTAVKAAYDEPGLKTLTNINVTDQNTVNDTVGTAAADHAIKMWPLYAEAVFDAVDGLHLAIGVRAVIAVLWERGGTAATIARLKSDDVFADDGLLGRLRKVGARARIAPDTNAPDVDSVGGEVRPWSHRKSMPVGFLPSRRNVNFNDD